ncbi:transmembrane emp24 domain-containing protein 6 [Corythoichthys intestinalis]|uniref:transmembrane emp24 domain-containing protein 6 n=1 Tax=Corythoichthys intestinalis TaxID=161448 RepID=UPI0025A5A037|nr:transmembrane emp24 domain-containing protein 6 [Corythoichthys intestinalis]XP_061812996.1 transmembrane emp24 domain-containing protein 6-like [Nerophis lumbriciformis]
MIGGRQVTVPHHLEMKHHALSRLLLSLTLMWVLGAHGGPLGNLHPNMTDQELFWGADQYDFAMVLPAAGMDCVWHFAHYGEKFYLNFVVQWVTGVGHDRHLSVTVNAPSGLLLSTVDNADGQIELDVKETGFYQMCFSNFHNRFGSMQVSLSFGVYYDHAPPEQQNQNKKDTAIKKLNDTLSIIEASSQRVENTVFHMFRHYNSGRMRHGADEFLLVSNQRRVNCCSAALSVLVVLAGFLQLRFLQSLFGRNADSEPRAC